MKYIVLVVVIGMLRRTLRRSSDSSTIEVCWIAEIESPVTVRAARAEIKKVRAFDEERTFLIEKCLILSQVHHGGIDFNLTEVRIDSGIECQVTPYPGF